MRRTSLIANTDVAFYKTFYNSLLLSLVSTERINLDSERSTCYENEEELSTFGLFMMFQQISEPIEQDKPALVRTC